MARAPAGSGGEASGVGAVRAGMGFADRALSRGTPDRQVPEALRADAADPRRSVKFILFPTGRNAVAHVISGESGDVSLYARKQQMGVAQTEETAIEDI